MNGLHATLAPYAKVCHESIRDFAVLLAPFLKSLEVSEPNSWEALGALSVSCLSTSDTAAFLVGFSRLWDAEILMRSVLEGTYKFLFMCTSDRAERAARVEEYWNQLSEVGKIKSHRKATLFLATVDDPASDPWRPIRDLMLDQKELEELQARYPRQRQAALDKKWSFGEIAKSLATSDLPAAQYMVLMLHSYGIGSHLVHQDGDGVGMIHERDGRGAERREAIELAHGLSELSDIFHLAMFRSIAAYQMLGMDPKPIFDMRLKYSSLVSRADEARVAWHGVEYPAKGGSV